VEALVIVFTFLGVCQANSISQDAAFNDQDRTAAGKSTANGAGQV